MPYPHVSGSLPLTSAEEVFEWAGRTLGDRARLIPDGETSEQRRRWLPHEPWFLRNPTLERGEDLVYGSEVLPRFRVKDGVDPAFDEPFEFGAWARESYTAFQRIRDAGRLPATAKFMVAMPHSVDAVEGLVEADSRDPIYAAFAKQVKASVDEIAESIPHEDLAIQWDIPTAACVWSGYYGDVDDAERARILREAIGHGEWVPDGVELGYHLCFGDGNEAENVGETRPDSDLPPDAAGITKLSNEIVAGTSRRVDFLHLPTYAHWLATACYEPLQGLDVAGAEISLGVINLRRDRGLETGIERTRRRTAAAREAIGATFGISSSCGLGRYTPEQFAAAGELFNELDQG